MSVLGRGSRLQAGTNAIETFEQGEIPSLIIINGDHIHVMIFANVEMLDYFRKGRRAIYAAFYECYGL